MDSSSSISSEEVESGEPDVRSRLADRLSCAELDLVKDRKVDNDGGAGRELIENPLRISPARLDFDSGELIVGRQRINERREFSPQRQFLF